MRLLWITALVAFALDQISKFAVVYGLNLISLREIPVLPPLLVFRYGENTGINFGLFSAGSDSARWVLVALSIAICVALLWWLRRDGQSRWSFAMAGLLIGGALGNVFDRVVYGYVLDFLNMSCCGSAILMSLTWRISLSLRGAIGLALFDTGSKKASKKGT